jgi:hypothetical protein
MVDVFVKRTFDSSVTRNDVHELVNKLDEAGGCLALHKVQWWENVLATDGHSMICRFTAADAESVRLALRRANVSFNSVWSRGPAEIPAESG